LHRANESAPNELEITISSIIGANVVLAAGRTY
jgi:hypothetical protein